MKKLLFILLPFVLLLSLMACSSEEPIEISRISAGKIIDADLIPTAFNASIKVQIRTELFFVILRGVSPAINIGAEAFKVTYSDGTEYFTWKGSTHLYRI